MTTNKLTAGENYTLHLGDNLATLKNYPDNHFDSIVQDPPYGIAFLGKDWDSKKASETTSKIAQLHNLPSGMKHTSLADDLEFQLWLKTLFAECLRVLKPGGYMLAFSAARTYHHTAMAAQTAGFEIRDQLMWLYSSGFPKAQDIGKAIDKRAGTANNLTRHDSDKKDNNGFDLGSGVRCPECKKDSTARYTCDKGNDCGMVFKPLTDEGKQWNGFKTALKPAHEPVVMARKPFKGSTIDNVLKHGLGAMNIDATRVPWADGNEPAPGSGTPEWRTGGPVFVGDGDTKEKKKKSDKVAAPMTSRTMDTHFGFKEYVPEETSGRYPSNVIGEVEEGYQKYFYCPKVSRKERHVGFEMPPALTGHIKGCYAEDGTRMAVGMDAAEGYRGNNHPTVKPVALMDYLIKLVTPPSTPTLQRKVLDPFMGSGSTGMAAVALGHHFTGCELDPKYVEISRTRIEAWLKPDDDEPQLPSELFGEV